MSEDSPRKPGRRQTTPHKPSSAKDGSQGTDEPAKSIAMPASASELKMPELPDYAKLLGDLQLPELPDYAKLLGDLQLPELPDYAKLLGDLQLPELPDYAKALGDLQLPELPDYTKLLGDLRLPELPDYTKLLGDLQLPELPDYTKLLGDLQLPELPAYSKSFDPSAGPASVPNVGAQTYLPSGVDSVPNASEEIEKLRSEIALLQKQRDEHANALSAAKAGSQEQKREIESLRSVVEQLKGRERWGFLLERVHPDAHQRLHKSAEFRDRFLATGECSAFVLSIDIRRSTELMLKARSPEKFASFLTLLSTELTTIVLNSLGVFDKFTGDGILAFFPDFFSGPDAAFRAVRAADLCHAAFERLYRESRPLFKSVLTNVGLGIGVDYGSVQIVQVSGGLTVVGEPVVYACRLSGGAPGITLVNQPAFEQVSAKCGSLCFTSERTHEVKHEGSMLAYEIRLNGSGHVPAAPEWAAKNEPAGEIASKTKISD